MQAAAGDRAARKGEGRPPVPEVGDALRRGGLGRFLVLIVIGPVELRGVREPPAGRGADSRGQCGKAGYLAGTAQRAAQFAGRKRRPRRGGKNGGADRARVGMEHANRDRVPAPARVRLHFAAPFLRPQVHEPLGGRFDRGNVRVRAGPGFRLAAVTVQEPRHRRALGPRYLSPRHHAALLRARQRHVQKPDGFREVFEVRTLLRAFVGFEVEDFPVVLRFVQMVRHGLRLFSAPLRVRHVPGEGKEDDRKFEPLGPVHGQDFDEILVAFEPELRLLVRASGLGPPPVQPGGQFRRCAAAPPLRVLQQVGQVADVRQPAHSVGLGEQPRRAALRFEQP